MLEPQVFDYISSDHTIWEREPMEGLAAQNQLMAFKTLWLLAPDGQPAG